MTVHPFIEAEKQDGHNVKRACELLKVSRAAFCARRTGKPGSRAVHDAELTGQISEVHAQSRGTYGAPRIQAVLKRQGAVCGRRRIARLMGAAGLEGRHRRRRYLTTVPDSRAATRPDLILRQFGPDPAGAHTRWCGDILYVPTEEGWLYLATVIDIGLAPGDRLGDRRPPAHRSGRRPALTAACRQRRPTRPVIFHSGPWLSVHQSAMGLAGNRVRHPPAGRPHRTVLGQRARRVVLRHDQTGVARHEFLAQQGRRPHRDLRLHRGLVLLAPTAQQPRLPQSRRIRERTRSLTTTPMVDSAA